MSASPLSRFASLFCVVCLAALSACGGSRPATTPATPAPDVLATYADERLTVAEFEDRYARSVGGREAAADDSVAAYRDFLDRYVDFRLKVIAARAAGLATDSALVAEIGQYRTNLARPYMLEQEVIEPVVRDLFEKQQTVVDASHILILAQPGALPADTLAAYNKLQAVVDSVRAGMPFEQAAIKFSEDPSARGNGQGAGGRLGFFTAGDMVDEFENMAYSTPVGGLSPIFRTRFGYHVLKVEDRKARPQDVRVAHIMIRPDGGDPAQLDSARALAQALRDSVTAGADFGTLAARHSDDPGSAARGGDLGALSWQTPVVEPFKSTAFALENAGDLSPVIETSFGFHVIKLLERAPAPTYEAVFSELKGQVARLPRAKSAQDKLARRILAEYGATADTARVLAAFAGQPYDSLAVRYREGALDAATLAQPVAGIGTESYTMDTVLDFFNTHRAPTAATPEEQAGALLDAFLLEQAIDYEAMRLEAKDDEFARIMGEFQDGLMLFRVMEDSVWQAAQRDSVGLMAYYEAHRDEYRFPDRTRIVSLVAPTDSLLADARTRIESGLTFSQLAAEISGNAESALQLDTVLIAGASNTVYDRALPLQQGQFVGPFPHRGNTRILLYHAGMEAARPKTFDEARAEVTTAYQDVLDTALRARLRARYDVRLFPERLSQVFAGEQTASPAGGAR